MILLIQSGYEWKTILSFSRTLNCSISRAESIKLSFSKENISLNYMGLDKYDLLIAATPTKIHHTLCANSK